MNVFIEVVNNLLKSDFVMFVVVENDIVVCPLYVLCEIGHCELIVCIFSSSVRA